MLCLIPDQILQPVINTNLSPHRDHLISQHLYALPNFLAPPPLPPPHSDLDIKRPSSWPRTASFMRVKGHLFWCTAVWSRCSPLAVIHFDPPHQKHLWNADILVAGCWKTHFNLKKKKSLNYHSVIIFTAWSKRKQSCKTFLRRLWMIALVMQRSFAQWQRWRASTCSQYRHLQGINVHDWLCFLTSVWHTQAPFSFF